MSKNEYETRLDRKLIARYGAGLLNDTKWREICLILAEYGVPFYMAYAAEDEWNAWNSNRLQRPLQVRDINERGIRDGACGGGPFRFKQLLWVRVPRRIEVARGRRSVEYDLAALRRRIEALGSVPLRETTEYLEVFAYEQGGF
jgi:hypothetical protein